MPAEELVELMRVQKQLEVGNNMLGVESVLLGDESHQIHGRRCFLLDLGRAALEYACIYW